MQNYCLQSMEELYLYSVYPYCNIYCNCSFEWRKYYGWFRWSGNGCQCDHRSWLGHVCFCERRCALADYLNIMYIPNLSELSFLLRHLWVHALVFYGTMLIRRRFSWAIPEALRLAASLHRWPLLYAKNY